MQMREIRQGFELLRTLLSDWQAKAAAGDLERIARLFEGHDEVSVSQFCSMVEKALKDGQRGLADPSQSGRGQLNDALIRSYLDEVRQSEGADESFEAAIAKIGKDKKMRVVELKALADAYLGVNGSYGNKASILKALRGKRASEASVERRLKGISGIF